uniref:Secreted protein n=1 Tax=Romanomermis culicivorax TaxID=13658 RepID=A0A915K1D5_ROMCU
MKAFHKKRTIVRTTISLLKLLVACKIFTLGAKWMACREKTKKNLSQEFIVICERSFRNELRQSANDIYFYFFTIWIDAKKRL